MFRLEESENPVEVEVEAAPNCTHKLEDFHPRELHTLQIHNFSFKGIQEWELIGVDEETKRERAGLAGADKPIWDIMIILQDRNRWDEFRVEGFVFWASINYSIYFPKK